MQTQINFLKIKIKLDKIQDFVLSVLKEKNLQAYLKFYAEINQEQKQEK